MATEEAQQRIQASNAEKRILAHFMYSGDTQEKQDPKKARMMKKLEQQKKSTPSNGAKQKEKKKNKQKKNFDLEAAVRNVLGSEYKPAKKKKKKRARRKNNKKNTQQAQPEHKSVEQRLCETAKFNPETQLLEYVTKYQFTIQSTPNQVGFHVPQLDLSLEASETRVRRKNILLSETLPQNMYGLCFLAEQSGCLIGCPGEKSCDKVETLLDAWFSFTRSEDEEEEEDIEKENERKDEEEAEESENDSEDFEEEEGDWGTVLFSGATSEVTMDTLHVEGLDYGSSFGYVISKSLDPSRRLLSYISQSSVSLRRHEQFWKSSVILLPCNFLEAPKVVPENKTSWNQIQPIISERPHATFVLTNFDDSYTSKDVYQFFVDLVKKTTIDLSNVVLFIPPQN